MLSAGIWAVWREKPEDQWLHSFAILTRDAGRVSSAVHDREPKILPPDRWEAWLTGSAEEAGAVLVDVPEPPLSFHPVSRAVNSWKGQGPGLIESIDL
jgi:putative SOS response-associated peptidase YedK